MARRPQSSRASVDEQLAVLDALPAAAAERRALLAEALGARHARVVAKAERLAWQQPLQSRSVRRALLRAAVAHRSQAALEWLLSLAADARLETALEVIEALALYKHSATLATRLEAVLAERGEPGLTARYSELWRGGKPSRNWSRRPTSGAL